jgi:hypothetical protein
LIPGAFQAMRQLHCDLYRPTSRRGPSALAAAASAGSHHGVGGLDRYHSLFTHVNLHSVKNTVQSMTPSMVHVTNLTPPGSGGNPSRAYGSKHQLTTGRMAHVTNPPTPGSGVAVAAPPRYRRTAQAHRAEAQGLLSTASRHRGMSVFFSRCRCRCEERCTSCISRCKLRRVTR